MKLLLHICCAPCAIYPLEQLKKKGYEVSGLFYNPNIHPFAEYKKRKQAVEDFSRKANLEVVYPEYRPAEFFQAVNMKEADKERCPLCWLLRLRKTANAAKERGFASFTTTLLVSPYQDQELLNKIGNDIAKEEQIEFYYADFRPGFKKAQEEARVKGIYCQNYCGCIYSEIARCKKSEKH
ncbi:MAG: epoxyqueuosine reductase QueH [Candidatus Omnitrophica bacterium]|nr:epoxyqueuosine reductase QueH [Candidatus Omnitrophota bacterium]